MLGRTATLSASVPDRFPSAYGLQVEARISSNLDRKSHPGVYSLFTSESGVCTKGSRHTAADAKPGPKDVGQEGDYFTDFFGFTYEEVGAGCSVASCSESQGASLCDFSTNFCNACASSPLLLPPPHVACIIGCIIGICTLGRRKWPCRHC